MYVSVICIRLSVISERERECMYPSVCHLRERDGERERVYVSVCQSCQRGRVYVSVCQSSLRVDSKREREIVCIRMSVISQREREREREEGESVCILCQSYQTRPQCPLLSDIGKNYSGGKFLMSLNNTPTPQ